MKSITKFVGLDVSKEKIAVAVADEGRGEQTDDQGNPTMTLLFQSKLV